MGAGVEIKQPQKDARGEVFKITVGDREFLFVTTNKGASRGGHSHRLAIKHIFVSGSFVYRYIENGKELEKTVKAGDVIDVEPGTVHMLTALEDSVFVEEQPRGQVTTNYPPWRKIVEEFLRNNKE